MDKRTKLFIILFAALFLLCAGAFLFLRHFSAPSSIADIYVDGVLYKTVDLQAVTIPYTEEIQTEYGSNQISVSHGSIAVSDADCPDRLCVEQGAVSSSALPIVCLPHRLVIQIREAE